MSLTTQTPLNAQIVRLMDRRSQLEISLLECLELNTQRYTIWLEIEKDEDMSESTRERRCEAIISKIAATEDEQNSYKTQIAYINEVLSAGGYGAGSEESFINVTVSVD